MDSIQSALTICISDSECREKKLNLENQWMSCFLFGSDFVGFVTNGSNFEEFAGECPIYTLI